MHQTNIKRQLVADVLSGKLNSLYKYRGFKQHQAFNLQWVIDARAISGGITAIDRKGNQIEFTHQQLAELPKSTCVWTIRDFSGGRRVPVIDEEYH